MEDAIDMEGEVAVAGIALRDRIGDGPDETGVGMSTLLKGVLSVVMEWWSPARWG